MGMPAGSRRADSCDCRRVTEQRPAKPGLSRNRGAASRSAFRRRSSYSALVVIASSPASIPRGPRRAALTRVLAAEKRCDRALALERDPVQFPRLFASRDDRAVAALLSALLAFGRVEIIRAKLAVLFAHLGPSPARTAREVPLAVLIARLEAFRHRTFRGADIARLVHAAGMILARDGSLYAPLERGFTETGSLRGALTRFADDLRLLAWPDGADRAARHLLPDPRGPSACKRLALLARWIARPDDGVDLGLSTLPTRALVIPLDVHVHRVARSLGFTHRTTASWLAAEEVTEALRALDLEDPVRFDFALCHVEIEAFRRRPRGRHSARSAG